MESVPGFGPIADELRRATVQVLAASNDSCGSGVILGPTTIVTNAHVATTDDLRVRYSSGELVKAKLKKRDRSKDLAVLSVESQAIAPATLRETKSVRIGEVAIAVGHPLGFIGAISTGVVRSIGQIASLGPRSWIQVALRLAPGNSGGPLADAHGRIIGINAMIVNGLGLAIPSDILQNFLSGAEAFVLGVAVQPARLRDGTHGLLIVSIEPNGAALRASLLPGDLVTAIDGSRTNTFDAFEAALQAAGTQRRDRITVHFRRGGSDHERQTIASSAPYREQAA